MNLIQSSRYKLISATAINYCTIKKYYEEQTKMIRKKNMKNNSRHSCEEQTHRDSNRNSQTCIKDDI